MIPPIVHPSVSSSSLKASRRATQRLPHARYLAVLSLASLARLLVDRDPVLAHATDLICVAEGPTMQGSLCGGNITDKEPYAFDRPSSANFLRGFLCNVGLSISLRRQKRNLRILIFPILPICIFIETESMTDPVAVIDDTLHVLGKKLIE